MNSTIAARLRQPRDQHTREEIRHFSEEVARRARAARYPAKSLSAVAREARRSGVNEELLRLVLEGARGILESGDKNALEKAPPPGRWLSPLEAASALCVPAHWVLRRLDDSDGRRLLGYPWFDGRRWHVPAEACDSKTRSAYLSSIPESEPPENIALLPD